MDIILNFTAPIILEVGGDSFSAGLANISAQLTQLKDQIMSTEAELIAKLTSVTATVAKIGTETSALKGLVETLTASLAAAGTTSPAVDAAMAALVAQVTVVDDLVPDAAAPAPAA